MPDPDYAAIAAQYGGTTAAPPAGPPAGTSAGQPAGAPDYAAIAAQYGGTSSTGTAATPPAPTATIGSQEPAKGPAQQFARWAGNVMNDLEYGTDHTGVGTVLKKMGAHGVSMGNSDEVGQFMASIPLGLLRFYKGMAEMTRPEHGAAAWQAVKDTFGGAMQAATIPGSFIAPEAGEAGSQALKEGGEMTAAGARAVAGKAAAASRRVASLPSAARELYTGEAAQQAVQADLAQGIRRTIKGAAGDRNVQIPDNIPSIRDVPAHLADALRTPPPATAPDAEAIAKTQEALQKGIRSVIGNTGKDAGLSVEEAPSIRDTAAKLSDALHDKASGIYQQLDEALGGTRFQAFNKNIRRITEALRNQTGTDTEAQSKLLEQLNEEQAKMQEAIGTLKEQGVDPKLIDEASATFRQHKGVEELSNNIRRTTKGLPAQLREAGETAAPETVHPGQLAGRLNAMYDSGTLQDALGQNHADDLLRHVHRADVATPKPTAALRSQSDALDEVTQAIRDSAEGSHPERRVPGQPFTPETLKIKDLFERLNDMADDGRLQEALGPQRARDLLQEVDSAHIRAEKIVRRVNRVKTLTKVGAIAGGAETARRTGEHLLEGTYHSR